MIAAERRAGRLASLGERLRRLPRQIAARPTVMLLVCNAAAQLVSVCAAPL